MPEMPLPFNRLIADMTIAAKLAANPLVSERTRNAAAALRDKAFAQFVWGE